MRAVRGAMIAVGCWKFAPAVVVIVSAAYAFSRLKPSRNRRTLSAEPSGTVFSTRRSTTEMLSWRKALSGVAKIATADKLPVAMLPGPPAAALNVHAHDAGAD